MLPKTPRGRPITLELYDAGSLGLAGRQARFPGLERYGRTCAVEAALRANLSWAHALEPFSIHRVSSGGALQLGQFKICIQGEFRCKKPQSSTGRECSGTPKG